ncbi:hypothetical protein [Butyrivibrio sp. YAB3001]|uniref:hypothetical protein n=1 Tax=Butyrivibrio sp. YAB3001 TaxID=1520812 RepID=UPI0008F65E38|nr:hypothetical protein [Butyrivibrio sp. YAB3001]SFC27549.1 hypothetical protein SAMN02910398_01874 [Butyrivibrio sp. YAB3001]
MVEYNAELMSDKDLIEAANIVFSAQEKDFEKIKTEKWYHTFFHAITLNQDGTKYAVRGIKSLAKLQQLFMNVYVKNYRKSHEQLDDVIAAVTKNSEAIKKLYGKCVLCLEEQSSLEQLDDFDAKILALFLGEYRDENGLVPQSVQGYNKGVLLALNQKVPSGALDNHQLSKLNAPKVVYRCFMEQCAVDGTIDTQEWCDKIYEDIRDFELSDNSKREIKESVKREVETAGVDYLLEKYNKDDGITDSDFIIQIEGNNQDYQPKIQNSQVGKPCDEHSLYMAAVEFDRFFIDASYTVMQAWNYGFLANLVTIQILNKEITDDTDFMTISNKLLHGSVLHSKSRENGFVIGIKIEEMYDNGEEHSEYFLILTNDAYFVFIDGLIAVVPIDKVKFATENEFGLEICAYNVEWFNEAGNKVNGDDNVKIKRIDKNKHCIRAFRKGLENFINELGGYNTSTEYEIERIIGEYIDEIRRGSDSAYMVKDFGTDYEIKHKKLKNALAKYAVKVREKDVIGFIDTSIRQNGSAGYVFTTEGMSFNYAFEKVFVYYGEIEQMTYDPKTKNLTMRGFFSERKNNDTKILIPLEESRNVAWIKMIQEIQCVI